MSLSLDSSPLALAARVVALVAGHSPSQLAIKAGASALGISTDAAATGFSVLTTLANAAHSAAQLAGATDAERAQVADWGKILSAELGGAVSPAFLARLDAHLLASSFLAAASYRPTIADYAAWAAVTNGTGTPHFDEKAFANLARWSRAVQASVPHVGAAAEAFLKGTPLADLVVAPAQPASRIFEFDIAAALAAEARGRGAAAAPAGAAPAAAAAGAGAAAAKGAKKDGADAAKPAAGADKKAAKPGKDAAAAPAAGAAAAAAPAKDAKPAKEKKAAAPAAAGGEVSQVYRVDFRVGRITNVTAHPTEARLYVLAIDVGADLGGVRTVVAGVAEHFPAASLQGVLVVLMVNVKAGDVKGVESAGRVMVATSADGTKKELATPPAGAVVGERVRFANVPESSKPDETIAPKRLHEIMKFLKTNANKEVVYDDVPFQTSAGAVTVPTIADGTVA